MTVTGKELNEGLKFIKQLYFESAELMKAIDENCNKNKWKQPLNSNLIYKDGSASLNNPGAWAPKYLFRYFNKSKKMDDLLAITLTFDWDFQEVGFDEPMLCCARIKFSEPVKTCEAAWAVLGGFQKFCHDVDYFQDCIYHNAKINKDYVRDDLQIESGKASGFYIPLVSVKNNKDVESLIIMPLLTLAKDDLAGCYSLIGNKAVVINE